MKVTYQLDNLNTKDNTEIALPAVYIDFGYRIFKAQRSFVNAKFRNMSYTEKDEAYFQQELESSLEELGDKGLYIGEPPSS